MSVGKAFENWITKNDVSEFIKLRSLDCPEKYAQDLDWLGIQAQQYEAGFDIDFQSELNEICRKYIRDNQFWLLRPILSDSSDVDSNKVESIL